MNKILLSGIVILVLFSGLVEAGLFDFNSVEPPFFGCSITGCTMQGSIDMNGYTIYNASLVNPSLVEFDPVFVAENSTLWAAINSKLNITDQRYNDTLLIGIINTSIYVDLNNEIDGRIGNDSYLQGQINYLYLNKLNETDQRYNDTQYIINALANYYNISESDATYYPLTNPAGYINESYANDSFYPLNSNPAGYINSTDLDNLTNGTWVKVTGDTMTGDLNMSNNSIWDVDILSVHNITGRSPVYISSPVISFENITATNFFGNINGQNGTIFGMTITNGTIENMHVSGSAIFNTSLLPELNDTWSLGNENLTWKNFYVANLYATNITAPNVNSYYADEIWIYRSQYGNTTDYIFYFNESKLNITLQTIYGLLASLNESLGNETQARLDNDSYLQGQINYVYNETLQKLNITDQRYNDTLFIQAVNETLLGLIGNETQDRINNDSYLQGQINYVYNETLNKLNITDQRYNDTQLVLDVNSSIWQELDLKLNITDQRYNDTAYIVNLLLEYYNKTEIDNLFQNFTYNETDPIFTAENISIWLAINTKLNETDQRYNDTAYIVNLLLNYYNSTEIDTLLTYYYNKTEIDGFLDLKMNITDQRYNDTLLITDVNTSIWNELALKLNISDQRYNDTQYIINELLNYYNKTEIDGLFANYTWNETDPIFTAENTTLWQAINSKLNITDQRYNDTAFILNELLNYYNISEIDGLFANYTWNETDPIFTAENSSIWNAINSKLNITDQRYNDTQYILNQLLNYYNITEIDTFFTYYYNKTEVDGFLDNKLNITDQRYNDTLLINDVNTSVWNELALKLNITDQRYNDTQYILNQLLNYYNITEIDTFFTYYYNKTEVDGFLDLKLNITDQRYNDTQFILNELLNYYNITEIDGFLDLKLNISDQRYNDTALINGVNQSIWNELALKLNITDQRYNDTAFILNELLNYYNKTEIDFLFQNFTYNETDPIFTAENISIWTAINLKLNITDQRYNDTQFILDQLLNYYNKTEIDTLLTNYYNKTEIDTLLTNYYNKTEVDGFLDLKLNVTDQRYNDTLLIGTVNTSIWNELALKLNITDQRYNDTQFILDQLLNYYNKTEIDYLFANYTWNETDPIFTAENVSIWQAINSKLNITDQRYNDTQYILNELLNYYNKTEVDGFLADKLNTTDQRYNDTALIIAVNTSLWIELDNKLNITDQRYNDTALIYAVNTSVWNELNNKLNITDQRYNDTALIYLVNTSVWNELALKLNITDQRYNDTALIYTVNTSLWLALDGKLNITDQRYNETLLIEIVNATIKQPTGPYLAYDNTTFWINETYLNYTINNISKVRKVTYNMTCTASSGVCGTISGINITHQITEVKVTPATITNSYKFLLTEYPNTALVIDKDRATHVGIWDIEKAYAINGQVQANITNANIDELFTISIIYLTNGVQ